MVWLVATGHHRSGAPDDAFQLFQKLREEGLLYPEENDFEDLLSDRGDEFVERARVQIPDLLEEARLNRDIEVTLEVGSEPVSCVVHVVETIEERYFSVSGNVGPSGLLVLQVLFAPDRNYDEWRSEGRLPTRDLDHKRSEMCFSILLDDADNS